MTEQTQPTDAPLNSIELMKVVMQADEETRAFALRGTTNWAAHIGKTVQNAVLAKWGHPLAGAGGELVACTYGDNGYACCEGGPCQADLHNERIAAPPPQAVREPQCWCLTCRPMRLDDPYSIRMALCPTCGNKRCPKANDHRNACTNSNEPGQPGSSWENVKPITAHGVADMKGGQDVDR